MFTAVAQITIAFGYALCCTLSGVAALRMLRNRALGSNGPSAIAIAATAFSLGHALLSQLLVAGGLATSFSPALVMIVITFGAVLGARPALHGIARVRSQVAEDLFELRTAGIGWTLLAITCIGLLGILGVTAWVTPPLEDAAAFYFTYGKFLAASRSLTPFYGPYEIFSSVGLVGEIHYAALMLISEAATAKLFSWFPAVAVCLLLWELGRLCSIGAIGRVILFTLVVTSTAFTDYAFFGKVDLVAASLGLAAIYWAAGPSGPINGRSDTLVAGALTAFSCIAKASYAPSLVPGVVILLALRPVSPDVKRQHTQEVISFAVIGIFASLPHIAKNLLWFGEPLAPFFVFDDSLNLTEQVWYTGEALTWILSTYPFALVFGQYPMQGGTLSYLWLAFLPFVALMPRAGEMRRNLLAKITIAGLVGLLVWLLLRPSVLAPRYILAPLLLLFLPVAGAVEYVFKNTSTSKILKVAVGFCMVSALWISVRPYLTSTPHDVVALHIPHAAAKKLQGTLDPCYPSGYNNCNVVTLLNDRAPEGSRAYLGFYYTYFTRPDLLACRETNDEPVLSREDPWSYLYGRGFDFVVVNKLTHANVLDALESKSVPEWLEVREVHNSDFFAILELVSRVSESLPRTARCAGTAQNGWRVDSKTAEE